MCLYPNRVFYTGKLNENGKKDTIFTSRFTDYMYRRPGDHRWIPASVSDAQYTKKLGYDVLTEYDDIPCGQCIECRINYARSWSCRIMNEVSLYPDDTCWFVTCTYNDEHLPKANIIEKINKSTGEISYEPSPFNSLSLRDHQLFMKNLRKEFSKDSDMKIKFFMSGEYGESMRPHFHYILFGVHLDDLILYKLTDQGDRLYTSKRLQDIWDTPHKGEKFNKGESRGFVSVGKVTTDSASYVARYAIKKRKMIDSDFYKDYGLKPEFLCMSRRPGIGKEWFMQHKDEIYDTDSIVLTDYKGVKTVKPPRYYDDLFAKVNMDQFEEIKENRKKQAVYNDQLFEHLHPFMDKEMIAEAKERKYNRKASIKKPRSLK